MGLGRGLQPRCWPEARLGSQSVLGVSTLCSGVSTWYPTDQGYRVLSWSSALPVPVTLAPAPLQASLDLPAGLGGD